jgi:hypothetical protein
VSAEGRRILDAACELRERLDPIRGFVILGSNYVRVQVVDRLGAGELERVRAVVSGVSEARGVTVELSIRGKDE